MDLKDHLPKDISKIIEISLGHVELTELLLSVLTNNNMINPTIEAVICCNANTRVTLEHLQSIISEEKKKSEEEYKAKNAEKARKSVETRKANKAAEEALRKAEADKMIMEQLEALRKAEADKMIMEQLEAIRKAEEEKKNQLECERGIEQLHSEMLNDQLEADRIAIENERRPLKEDDRKIESVSRSSKKRPRSKFLSKYSNTCINHFNNQFDSNLKCFHGENCQYSHAFSDDYFISNDKRYYFPKGWEITQCVKGVNLCWIFKPNDKFVCCYNIDTKEYHYENKLKSIKLN